MSPLLFRMRRMMGDGWAAHTDDGSNVDHAFLASGRACRRCEAGWGRPAAAWLRIRRDLCFRPAGVSIFFLHYDAVVVEGSVISFILLISLITDCSNQNYISPERK